MIHKESPYYFTSGNTLSQNYFSRSKNRKVPSKKHKNESYRILLFSAGKNYYSKTKYESIRDDEWGENKDYNNRS